MSGEPAIFCPQCRWRPSATDRWMCTPGCGMVWNTFWTHGLCPGCSHQWHETQCLVCHRISPHEAWYHWPDEDESRRRKRKEREPSEQL
jgi:hypothetical protein